MISQAYATNNYYNLSTTFNGVVYPDSFIDSGTISYVFTDNNLTSYCSNNIGFLGYCPTTDLALSAVLGTASGSASGTVNFNVGNTINIFGNGNYAESDLAGPISSLGNPSAYATTFDWGLPFFYGRSVYLAFNGRSTPGGTGPYYAY